MKIVPADFRKLQASVVLAVLMIAVGALALYFAFAAMKRAEQARVSIAAQFAEADGKLKQVRNEESEVKQKSIVFNKLQERGIIGDEQRLDWVELLKEIRDKHRLIDLRYEIAPQRMLEGQLGNDFVFFASSMKLELKLLHEEDLTRLLDDLRRQAKALIRVNSCRIERLPATGEQRGGGRANLLADCEIEWLTLRDLRGK
ncbi:MAG: hypothetical protein DVS81_03375 [Candidatus Accumulibacter meliphilus]|jgi:hypothetical protein|uniref:Uncharacterized protein n=1 Tax=Candidatus Accumulibacter meliphilus TaxID=2211374 RepID=A0A369XX70_9PROT|nr:MAG: hypothetical protein DVS81_03375 [Candidatus Accumulibacter meliphilus]